MLRFLRHALTVVATVVVLVVVLAAAYVGVVAVRHIQQVSLPAPDGRYAVGRTTVEWTDHGRVDPLAGRPGTPRRLAVWLWYPAATWGRPAAYAPGDWRRLHLDGPFTVGETRFAAIRTHASDAAPVAGGRFPVVVLEPGMGLAAPQFTTLAEQIASHGYVVAGVTPTYSANVTVLGGRVVTSNRAGNPARFTTATGDRLVPVWAADARFVASRTRRLAGRFAGHVDPARTTYVGHSFGGATSLQACADDRGCAGAVDLDGTPYGPVVHRGSRAPFLVLGSDGSCVTAACRPGSADDRASARAARSLFAASTGAAWTYQIAGTEHFAFTDYDAYYLAAPVRQLIPLGTLDGDRALRIAGTYVTAFLDHTVTHTPEPLLAAGAHRFPEVRAIRVPR